MGTAGLVLTKDERFEIPPLPFPYPGSTARDAPLAQGAVRVTFTAWPRWVHPWQK